MLNVAKRKWKNQGHLSGKSVIEPKKASKQLKDKIEPNTYLKAWFSVSAT